MGTKRSQLLNWRKPGIQAYHFNCSERTLSSKRFPDKTTISHMEHQQIQEVRNFPQQLCDLNSYEIQSKTHQYLPLKYAVLENY